MNHVPGNTIISDWKYYANHLQRFSDKRRDPIEIAVRDVSACDRNAIREDYEFPRTLRSTR